MKLIIAFMSGIFLLIPTALLCDTVKVPADYSTIQNAINAVQNGDTILVTDGIYEGDINFNGLVADSVIIKSEAGPDNCIIDCENGAFSIGFIFNSEDCKSTIDGFTIRNATMGIWSYASSSPTIKNNVIEDCEIGINSTSEATPYITSNIIKNNANTDNYYEYGAGIRCSYSSAVISGNEIINNNSSKGGGIYSKFGSPVITQNTISDNTGGGIYLDQSPAEIIDNEITNNEANSGGGIYCLSSSPVISHNKIQANYGCGIYCSNSSPEIKGNEIFLNDSNTEIAVEMICTYDNYNRRDECIMGPTIKGAGIAAYENSNPDIQNNIIHDNVAFHSGGIFCDGTSTASIINNHIVDNTSSTGASVCVENSSAKIINNIVANTKISSGEGQTLSRWYKDDLYKRYTYDGAKLDYVTYYFGFINNGPAGTVQISGCTGLVTSVYAETNERFWVEAPSDVSEYGDGGGFDISVSMDGVGFTISDWRYDQYSVPHGCTVILSPTITSYGTGQEGIAGAGIMLVNQSSMPEISYNDIYGNPGGEVVFSDASDSGYGSPFDLSGTDGNISEDPLIDSQTYELLAGSPCIETGKPDVTGLNIDNTDYLGKTRFFDADDNGSARIDIGAIESQNSAFSSTEYVSICQGESYLEWTETGEYVRNLSAAGGEDSTVTTILTVHPTFESEEDISICEGDNYFGISEAGTHTREFKTVNDCDSVIVTHLTVYPKYNYEENVTVCEGENYYGITEAGTYTREFTSVNDCDSIVVTHLTITPNYEAEESVAICQGENYYGITNEGTHIRELESVFGCDSTITTHLAIHLTYESEEDITICSGNNYLGLTEEGVHLREFKSVNDCDSVIVTNLSFYPVFKPVFTVDADTLTSDNSYASYQWFNSMGAIGGATEQKLVITESSNYYLEAANNDGCTFSSDAQFVTLTSIDEIIDNGFMYSIMPNPNSGVFYFRIDANPPQKLQIRLINSIGQELFFKEIDHPQKGQMEQLDVSHIAKGIYQLVIVGNDFMGNKKIVVQ